VKNIYDIQNTFSLLHHAFPFDKNAAAACRFAQAFQKLSSSQILSSKIVGIWCQGE